MDKKHLYLSNKNITIPAILWGKPSAKLLIEVHGSLSNKEDTVISIMAQKAVAKGYQALSFDLPMHGERVCEDYACIPENCLNDLIEIHQYARSIASETSVFACSIGAYFSLLAYHDFDIKQSLFLSPVVNMKRIICNMMDAFEISEKRLKTEKKIKLPICQTLDWDYYCYVQNNPISFDWKIPTAILYGSNDNLSEWEDISAFASRNQAAVRILEHGEHYFHTETQLQVFDGWAEENLL